MCRTRRRMVIGRCEGNEHGVIGGSGASSKQRKHWPVCRYHYSMVFLLLSSQHNTTIRTQRVKLSRQSSRATAVSTAVVCSLFWLSLFLCLFVYLSLSVRLLFLEQAISIIQRQRCYGPASAAPSLLIVIILAACSQPAEQDNDIEFAAVTSTNTHTHIYKDLNRIDCRTSIVADASPPRQLRETQATGAGRLVGCVCVCVYLIWALTGHQPPPPIASKHSCQALKQRG